MVDAVVTLPSQSQREAIGALAPPWLGKDTAERLLYDLGLGADALLEKLNQAMRAHMPGAGDPSALPLLATDRVLIRGPSETDAAFALRLTQSFDAWQHAGARRSVMAQELGYVSGWEAVAAGQVPRAVIVSNSAEVFAASSWDTFYNTSDTSQQPAHVRVLPLNWNWDNINQPWRAWLVLFFEAGSAIAPEGAWGGGVWGDGGAWGLTESPTTWSTLRTLLRTWKSARTFYPWLIVCFNGDDGGPGDELSPNSTPGAGNPDGTWGRWSKVVAGVRVPSRSPNCRFVDGSGVYQFCNEPTGT